MFVKLNKLKNVEKIKNHNNVFRSIEYEKELRQILSKDLLADKELVDEIIEILTKTLVVDERKYELNNLEAGLNDKEIDKLANLTKINGYHSVLVPSKFLLLLKGSFKLFIFKYSFFI